MQRLYPNIVPYSSHQLATSDGHTLYVEESGSPCGIPVVVVHGGPGAGCNSEQRRFFDPSKYRIILFDQRGCGQSTPHGGLNNNTTADLIDDLETIRQHLAIEKWVVFGGSWGATLSLLYAQAHPKSVRMLILRSVLLANQQDAQWFFGNGAPRIFPDAWQDFIAPIERKYHNDIIAAYHRLLNDNNELKRMASAKTWVKWQHQCSTLRAQAQTPASLPGCLRLARIQCHYYQHQFFIDDNQILKNIFSIRNIPAVIIHGRYDMICSVSNSYHLQQRWPRAKLEIIRDAGHDSHEPGMIDAIIRATNTYSKNQGAS